ncbi:DNA/RNA non-specific endonuclease, partial [Streptoalloteichus hindustanus]
TVHNLTVADLHTYYVIAAGTPVLVHNQTTCQVVDREREATRPEPRVDPRPGPRLDPTKSKKELDPCFHKAMPVDVAFNAPMESFKYLGDDALRAKGGTVCVATTTKEDGQRATPVGFPPSGSLNGNPMDRGHLIAARLHGSNNVDNIVPMYQKVNRSDVKIIENAVARALKTNKSVLYTVWVQYPSPTAAIPQWIFMDAVGDNGFQCNATIENVPGGAATKFRC